MVSVVNQVWALRGPVITTIALLVFLPLALSDAREARCAYVVLVMAVLWLTEAIPIPATALMPIFMFPMCGVLQAKEVSKSYVSDTTMLFLGGLMLAVAVEEWGLHRRIAVGVLRIVGADPKFVMLGVLLPTWFLSMWISNTATASMMIPIANAVASQMTSVRKDEEKLKWNSRPLEESVANGKSPGSASSPKYTYHGDTQEENLASTTTRDKDIITQDSADSTVPSAATSTADIVPEVAVCDAESGKTKAELAADARLCKGLSLCIAYGCNIGGIATLTGTPPNLVFKGQADDFYNDRYRFLHMPEAGSGVTFANWMGMALPMSALTLLLGWLLLMVFFLRERGLVCQNQRSSEGGSEESDHD